MAGFRPSTRTGRIRGVTRDEPPMPRLPLPLRRVSLGERAPQTHYAEARSGVTSAFQAAVGGTASIWLRKPYSPARDHPILQLEFLRGRAGERPVCDLLKRRLTLSEDAPPDVWRRVRRH